MKTAGVDGCPGGWVAIIHDINNNLFSIRMFNSAEFLFAACSDVDFIAIDMPIGLSNNDRRLCDVEARKLLGERASCVSNAPIRQALYAPSRLAASDITESVTNRRVGVQEFALYPKIIDLDRAITPDQQDRFFEIHPEICFWAWNNNFPIAHSKKTQEGKQARDNLIDAAWPGARMEIHNQLTRDRISREYVALDDVNDAFAALWTAIRKANNTALRIPLNPEIDERNLRMEMWY